MCERILTEPNVSSELQNSVPQSNCVGSQFSESEDDVLLEFRDSSDDDDSYDTEMGGNSLQDRQQATW